MLKTVILLGLLLVFGQSPIVVAGDYIWPMKLRPELTSRFCDYRAGHFHAGLDIRTNGKTGYRIYAVGDGQIFRASIAFNGYGRALYLSLNDGRIVVYGHLSSFGPEIDKLIRNHQITDKRYRQDLYFERGEFPVKKGQYLGLSGESGAGAPHLHFELRSANNNPINPFNFGFGIIDKRPPQFDKLAVRIFPGPYDPGANSNVEIYDIRKSGESYIVPDTIIAGGDCVLAVSGGDRIENSGYLYGFYKLRLFLDDSLIYSSAADSISYQSTNQQDYLRDQEIADLNGTGRNSDNDENVFHKLYIPPGAKQYFWKNEESIGIIPLPAQKGTVRKYTVVAEDEFGNESKLTGYLLTPALNKVAPELVSYYRFGDSLEVDFLTFDSVSACNLMTSDNSSARFRTLISSLAVKTWNRLGQTAYLNSIKAVSSGIDSEYKFNFTDTNGNQSPWEYFIDRTASVTGFRLSGSPDDLIGEYIPDSIFTNLDYQIFNETVTLSGQLFQSGVKSWYMEIGGKALEGDTRFIIKSSNSVLLDTLINLCIAAPGQNSAAYSPDSTLSLLFNVGSAYYRSYIFPSAGENEKWQGYDITSFSVEPSYLLADRPVKFRFDLIKLGKIGGKTGAYGYSSAHDKWGFIGTGEKSIEADGLGLGKVALIDDNDPPAIHSIKPSNSTKSRRPLLSCTIEDKLSGISMEKPPEMWIDGIWVPAEYDLDTKRFAYQVRGSLKTGRHSIKISATDNQGNQSSKIGNFSIK